MRTLVWFRGKDLRVSDHAPLTSAVRAGEVVCLFVLDPYFFAPERAREIAHRMQFLLESIASLRANLEHLGSRLLLVEGKSIEVVPRVAREWSVDRVVAQRWTEPFARARDATVARDLHVPLELFEGETLATPSSVRNAAGLPFSVFTPFARKFRAEVTIDAPLPKPRALPPVPADVRVRSVELPSLERLGIARNPALLAGGERAGVGRLAGFLDGRGARYADERDHLDRSTSRLSVDLKFGTLSPTSVWCAARDALLPGHRHAWESFSNELLWREFAYAALWEDPGVLERPHRPEFAAFPWENDPARWAAWCEGRTGYPVVDAAARQLVGEGFVHNRARMIAASFLTKDLLIDYRRGEAHYMKYLTDGDWAVNNFGWQWTTGCGFDAAPYFRVFNPVDQGRRFDKAGDYVRRWVPELAALPLEYLHAPWTAPRDVLRTAGVRLGHTYPQPIVDHKEGRARFLALASGQP